jgi:F-type H+-transporting ATPase subunit epsilon
MYKKKELKIELITPERVLLDSTITFATIPSGSGPVGVLPNHAPLLGNLFRGVLMVRDISGKEFNVFVRHGSFMISHAGIKIVTLAAEIDDQIDIDRATAAKDRASKILVSKDVTKDMERAKEALIRAETRINIAQATRKTR